MRVENLREEVAIELASIDFVIRELALLRHDLADREPTVREKTAASAFLAQFYGGIENILKRMCRFHSVALPTGDTWHVDLLLRFCDPPLKPLPVLFDEPLALAMASYRKFRQVVHHGYGFQVDSNRMEEGVEKITRCSLNSDGILLSI